MHRLITEPSGNPASTSLRPGDGASRVLTMTLHSSQVHGFFSVPVDHLHALRELASHFRDQILSGTVVVSPDLGNAKSAAAFAARLGLPVAAGAKERIDDHTVRI